MKTGFNKTFLLLVLASACTSSATPKREFIRETARIPLMQVLPDTVLANVSDYLIAPSGAMYLADATLKHIVLLDDTRNLTRIVGREGQGPGEFQWPYRLALVRDTLKVWDRLNARLQSFTLDGNFLSMVRPKHSVSGIFPLSISDDGRLLVPTYGIGAEYLLRVYDGALTSSVEFGTLEAPATSVLLMGLRKSDARSGTIPDELKNRAFAIPSGDGGMLLVHTTIPVFKKYDSLGRELWRIEQDLPELQVIRAEAFERTLQETGTRVFTPDYWRGCVNDGHGGCYLQLRSNDQVVLFHLEADGTLGGRITGPDGNWGTLRRFQGLLWLLNPETLELMQIQVVKG
jgi:hypothetical protein